MYILTELPGPRFLHNGLADEHVAEQLNGLAAEHVAEQ